MKKLLIPLFLILLASIAWGVIVPDRIDYRYNVIRYGAKGDGVTNDRAAIQAALTAGAGGTVFVPEGVYIADSLWIPSKTTLLGTGRGSVIKQPLGNILFIICNADTSSGADSNIVIDGLSFDGQQAFPSYTQVLLAAANDAIILKRVTGGAVRNCFVANSKRDGITLRTSKDCAVTGNYIWNSAEDGIATSGGSLGGHAISNNTVIGQDSTFRNASGDIGGGILVKTPMTQIDLNRTEFCGTAIDVNWEGADSLYGITVTNNRVTKWLGNGIALLGAHHSSVTGNWLWDGNGFGVVSGRKINTSPPGTAYSHDIEIAGNRIWKVRDYPYSTAEPHAIELQWGWDYAVKDNYIDSVEDFGIWSRAHGTVISGNIIRKTGDDGIHISDSSRHIKIINNDVDSAGLSEVTSHGYGIYVLAIPNDSDLMVVSENRVRYSYLSGIRLDSVDFSTVTSNVMWSNNLFDSSNSSGIRMVASSNNTVSSNVTLDHAYGIRITDGSNGNVVHGNVCLAARPLGGPFLDTFSIVLDTSSHSLIYGNNEDTLGVSQFFSNLPGYTGDPLDPESLWVTKGYVDNLVIVGDTVAKVLYNPGTIHDSLKWNSADTGSVDTLTLDGDEAANIVRSPDNLYVEANKFGIPGGALLTINPDTVWANDSAKAFLGTAAFPWLRFYNSNLYLHETTGTDSWYRVVQTDGTPGYVLTRDGDSAYWSAAGTGQTDTLSKGANWNGTAGFNLVSDSVGTRKAPRGLIEGSYIAMSYSGDSGLIITGSAGGGGDSSRAARLIAPNSSADSMRLIDGVGGAQDTTLIDGSAASMVLRSLDSFYVEADKVGKGTTVITVTADTVLSTKRITAPGVKADTIYTNGDVIKDFTGTNLSVTGGVLNATGTGSAWTWQDSALNMPSKLRWAPGAASVREILNVDLITGDSSNAAGNRLLDIAGTGLTDSTGSVRINYGLKAGSSFIIANNFASAFTFRQDSAYLDGVVRINSPFKATVTADSGLATLQFVRDSAAGSGGLTMAQIRDSLHANGMLDSNIAGVNKITADTAAVAFVGTGTTAILTVYPDSVITSKTIYLGNKASDSALPTKAWVDANDDVGVGGSGTAMRITGGAYSDSGMLVGLHGITVTYNSEVGTPDTFNVAVDTTITAFQKALPKANFDDSIVATTAKIPTAATADSADNISDGAVDATDKIGTGAVSGDDIADQASGVLKADMDTTAANYVFDDAYRGTSAVADSAYATELYARDAAGDSAASIQTGDVTNQTLTKSDLDTTASNFVFDDAYRGTSAVADSALATEKYARDAAGDTAVALRAESTLTKVADAYVTGGAAGPGVKLAAQTILKNNIDTTAANFVFDDAYRGSSAFADSAYGTEYYARKVAKDSATAYANAARAVIRDTVGLTGIVTSTSISDQSIVKGDVDSTASNIVFDDAYRGTSAVADSALATEKYARDAAGDTAVALRAESTLTKVSDAYVTGGAAGSGVKLAAQTILKNNIDTTAANFVFDDAYRGTSAVGDSAYATEKYARDAAGDTAVALRAESTLVKVADASISGGVAGSGVKLAAQTIIKNNIDSTAANFIFDDAYRGTSATADSVLATEYFVKKTAGDSATAHGGGGITLATAMTGMRDTLSAAIGMNNRAVLNVSRLDADTIGTGTPTLLLATDTTLSTKRITAPGVKADTIYTGGKVLTVFDGAGMTVGGSTLNVVATDTTIVVAADGITVGVIATGDIATNAVTDAKIDWPSHRRMPDRWSSRVKAQTDSLILFHPTFALGADSGATEIWDVMDSSYDASATQLFDTLWALWLLQPNEDQIDSVIIMLDNEPTANDSSCIYKIQFYPYSDNGMDVNTCDLNLTTGWVNSSSNQIFATNLTNITTGNPGQFYAIRVILGVTSGTTKGRISFNIMAVFDD